MAKNTRAGGVAEGAHLHIVHLADAGSSLDLIKVGFCLFPCIYGSHLLVLLPIYHR